MLKAYFDDSGTHVGADAIIVAGLLAHEQEWAQLQVDWLGALARFGLRKMHMSSCEAARKEFRDWSRDRRDLAISTFAEIIGRMDALMLISALSRSVWERVATETRITDAFPSPVDLCFNDCFQKAIRWRKSSYVNQKVAVIFDERAESLDAWRRRANGYVRKYPSIIAGFDSGQSANEVALQAADMIAYEGFVFHCQRERLGCEPPPRPNFERLIGRLPLRGTYMTYENLMDYWRQIEKRKSE